MVESNKGTLDLATQCLMQAKYTAVRQQSAQKVHHRGSHTSVFILPNLLQVLVLFVPVLLVHV